MLLIIMGMVFLLIATVMLIRSNIVFTCRINATEIVSEKAKQSIEDGYSNWIDYYAIKDAYGSYTNMWLDLRKWKFDDFYPGLRDSLKRKPIGFIHRKNFSLITHEINIGISYSI